ncbi:hypothetical protein [Butyrivibrio sp. AE2032]|uniref:hypothetical protein n=1 Tax=Butyrivibrio sp. AE2032 TaxID=1458463 RepID=UPI000555CFF2|nr:hypothetical protein [Butyrivibrio sp. AE2032]
MGKEFTQDELNKRMVFVESLFEKYGAKPQELNEKQREKFGQRRIFKHEDSFFRVDNMQFQEGEKPFIVISCTDDEKYASVGMLDDIDALEADVADEELEKAVRYAFGVEPYPEDYSSNK